MATPQTPRRARLPRYPSRPHATGQARVKWRGVTYYLGKFGSPESRARFHALLAQILADSPHLRIRPKPQTVRPTYIYELIRPYLDALRQETSKGQWTNARSALKLLVSHHGRLPIKLFRPVTLANLVGELAKNLKRPTVQSYLRHYRRFLSWWTVREVFDGNLLTSFQAVTVPRVAGMEGSSKLPVPDAIYQQTLPFVREPWRTMLRVQRDCGMRPSEVLNMRLEELRDDGRDIVWIPQLHKTAHRKKIRTVVLPPWFYPNLRQRSQRQSEGYLFTKRTSPRKLSHTGYIAAVSKAVERAAKKGIHLPNWTPGQLRHSAADEFAAAVGPRDAQILMGHSKLDTLNIYLSAQVEDAKSARRRLEKARENARLERQSRPESDTPAADRE